MFEQHNTPDKLWGCMEAMSEVADDEMREFEQQDLTDAEMADMREVVQRRILTIAQRLLIETEGYEDEITHRVIQCEYEIYHA